MRLIKRIFRDKISQFPAYTPLNGPRACGRAFAVARIERQYVTLERSLVGKCHSELRLRNKEEICHSMHVKREIWVEALIGTL